MQLQEDISTTANKSREIVTNLHSKIDHLETKNLDSQLHSRDSEGATLKKEIETKEDPKKRTREERQDHQEENVRREVGNGKMDHNLHQ